MQQAGEITKAWLKIHQILDSSGNPPNIYILDNECFSELKSAMSKKKLAYQLVPPNVHRRNASERAIQTFKLHFLAGLAV